MFALNWNTAAKDTILFRM